MTKSLILYLAVSLIFFSSCGKKTRDNQEKPYVIMLSMDGFRWDYPDRYPTPNLDKIALSGVRAKALIPSFPTKTFPNHYSLATGLYPDHHGIVNNVFYEPKRKVFYSPANRETVEDPYFYFGEPIWVTAEKQGITSASFYWVGSEAPVEGIRPTYWKKFDSSVSFSARIDTIISWLELPEEKRPHLITWYFEEPDLTGHDFGPESAQMSAKIGQLDSLVGIFMNKIQSLSYSDRINLIFTSDHGMCPTDSSRYINIMDYLREEWLDYVKGYNPFLLVQPAEGSLEKVKHVLEKVPHLNVWMKDSVPERLNYGKSGRISDLVVLADSSWSVGTDGNSSAFQGGTHGYDNENTDMWAIFYATGPAFGKNISSPTFLNVDIYNLIAYILQLDPVLNDGSFTHVSEILKDG